MRFTTYLHDGQPRLAVVDGDAGHRPGTTRSRACRTTCAPRSKAGVDLHAAGRAAHRVVGAAPAAGGA